MTLGSIAATSVMFTAATSSSGMVPLKDIYNADNVRCKVGSGGLISMYNSYYRYGSVITMRMVLGFMTVVAASITTISMLGLVPLIKFYNANNALNDGGVGRINSGRFNDGLSSVSLQCVCRSGL